MNISGELAATKIKKYKSGLQNITRVVRVYPITSTVFYFSPERPDSDHTEGDRITAQFQEWGIPLRGHAVVWSVANHNPDWFEANPKIEDLHFRIDDIIGRNKGPGLRIFTPGPGLLDCNLRSTWTVQVVSPSLDL